MSNTPPLTGEERVIAKEELTILYDQVKALDENLYRYSSVFFTINAALLAFLAQLHAKDGPATDASIYLLICLLGFASAVFVFLIALKGYFTWEIQYERVRELEKMLGYKIEEAYYQSPIRKEHWAARNLSISKMRVFFNVLLGLVWVVLIIVFPRLTNFNAFPNYLLLYPILIPLMGLIVFAIIFAPMLINRFTKGGPVYEQSTTHLG